MKINILTLPHTLKLGRVLNSTTGQFNKVHSFETRYKVKFMLEDKKLDGDTEINVSGELENI